MRKLVVCLATCNGERFLEAQLASLAAQTLRPDLVLVSDDRSDDQTPAILAAWRDRHPDWLRILETPTARLGARGNFARLLDAALAAGADLAAPCDQDDVWEPGKLQAMADALADVHGPALAVCDLAVVDADLRQLHASFWDMQRFPAACVELRHLTVMNAYPGCAMLANRALMEAVLPVATEAFLHDWWLALGAASCGRIIRVDRPLVRYRQHGRNTLGARNGGAIAAWRRGLDAASVRTALAQAAGQCQAMRQRLGEHLSGDADRLLRAVALTPTQGWFSRRRTLWAAGIGKVPWLRQLWFLAAC